MFVTTKACLHVTSADALESILKNGLEPRIGPLSEQLETQPAVYLFPSWADMEDASWLFDEAWPYDSEPVLLAVDTSSMILRGDAHYEVICEQAIAPERIRVLADTEFGWEKCKKKFASMGGLLDRESQISGRVRSPSGLPLVLFHGTSSQRKEFAGFTTWGAQAPELAQDYAKLRAYDGSQPIVVPAVFKSHKAFDADRLPSAVTVAGFIAQLIEQAPQEAGATTQQEQDAAQELANIRSELVNLARREESGPHYSRHNFWHEPETFFGEEGAKAIRRAFDLCGFDAIEMTEQGFRTVGVFSRWQIEPLQSALLKAAVKMEP